MTPCVPLSVTFNSCCNSLGGGKRYFTTDLHGSEVWGSSMLPWERASYGSLAVQIWLGSSWAVAAEFICCCCVFLVRAFVTLRVCQRGPGWTFKDGGHSLLCIFWSGDACQESSLAQNHIRVQNLQSLCRGTIWCSEPFPWYFELEGFSYITMTPQCALVASDCGVSSHSCFMFDSH